MAYNPSIPQAADFLSVSQAEMLANFNKINFHIEEDHQKLSDPPPEEGQPEYRGKHSKISFVEQAGDPNTIAGEVSVYTKDSSGQPEMFMRAESNGTVTQITRGGRAQAAIRLDAFVIFDGDGKVLQSPNFTNLAYNVSSITKNARDDWTVNFTNALANNFYFWDIQAFYGPLGNRVGNQTFMTTVPYMFDIYNNVVTTNSIRVMTKNVNNASTADDGITKIITLKIYTVG